LRLNSLGDSESKQRYRDALVAFLKPKAATISQDSQRRLETNPLRILDSKDARDIAAAAGAPPASEYLSEKSRSHFARVTALLADSAVPFTVDGTLVRGFDYYTDTLWEVTAGGLGAQNAIGGGGRYDNLVEQLGGRPTAGVGFGSGLERLLIALDAQGIELPRPKRPLVWLISNGEPARDANLRLLGELRAAGIVADMDLGRRSMKSQIKLADRERATVCVIVGETELASNQVAVKDLATGTQMSLPRGELIEKVRGLTKI
jgi:histidyl-tRNA synthetase